MEVRKWSLKCPLREPKSLRRSARHCRKSGRKFRKRVNYRPIWQNKILTFCELCKLLVQKAVRESRYRQTRSQRLTAKQIRGYPTFWKRFLLIHELLQRYTGKIKRNGFKKLKIWASNGYVLQIFNSEYGFKNWDRGFRLLTIQRWFTTAKMFFCT